MALSSVATLDWIVCHKMDFIFPLMISQKLVNGELRKPWKSPRAEFKIEWDMFVFLGFPGGSDFKESACSAGDLGSILGWEDPLEEGMATHSSILA